MVFLFIAVDWDWHIYVFDMIYQSNMLLWDFATEIRKRQRWHWIEFEYIIADSAWSRERLELKQYWIITKTVNKRRKESNMSNRRWWILRINQLFNQWKLIISDKCESLIDE